MQAPVAGDVKRDMKSARAHAQVMDSQGCQARRGGWLYRALALLAVLWNALGCLDFGLTITRYPPFFASMPSEVRDWLDAAPGWTWAVWAMGVGGGLMGAVLLLARRRGAVWAFALSLSGLAAHQGWQLTGDTPAAVRTPTSLAMSVMVWIVASALLWHAARLRTAGVLR